MYSVVKQCIRYKGTNSEFFNSQMGVKQGDPSSSLLFLLFVNDIVQNINSDIEGIFSTNELNIFLLMFADDAAIFSQSTTALQNMLNPFTAEVA